MSIRDWRVNVPSVTGFVVTGFVLSPGLSGRLLSSRACFRFLDPLSLPEFLCSICQRSTGRSLRFRGLCTGISAPNTPYRLFQGRPVYHNSIFVDDA